MFKVEEDFSNEKRRRSMVFWENIFVSFNRWARRSYAGTLLKEHWSNTVSLAAMITPFLTKEFYGVIIHKTISVEVDGQHVRSSDMRCQQIRQCKRRCKSRWHVSGDLASRRTIHVDICAQSCICMTEPSIKLFSPVHITVKKSLSAPQFTSR